MGPPRTTTTPPSPPAAREVTEGGPGHLPASPERSVDPPPTFFERRADQIRDALDTGRAGPFLFHGPSDAARALLARLSELLSLAGATHPGDTIGLTDDPVGETTAMLRDNVHLRIRVLKKVFEGRLTEIRRPGGDPGPGVRRAPPAQIEVVLRTEDDERVVRLEGGFATAFWTVGPQIGNIIQIDTDHPIVVIRQDREASEGRVAEERDLVYRIRLGDIDRNGVPPDPEPQEGGRAQPPAALRRPLLGTGRVAVPSLEAMATTDKWVEQQTGGKGTRLEPGILLVTDADQLPNRALIVLREAVHATAAPILILQTEDATIFHAWSRTFPDAVPIDE